jgi:hypothetical protein
MPFKTPEAKRAYYKAWYQKNKAAIWRDAGDLRKCTGCAELKVRETDFPKLKHARIGFKSRCKACTNKRAREKRGAPTWTGLTREHYQKYVREGRCFICDENKPRMAVDHCHATQTKRGVLCPPCNRGLGYFRDNPVFLEAAAAYLRQPR